MMKWAEVAVNGDLKREANFSLLWAYRKDGALLPSERQTARAREEERKSSIDDNTKHAFKSPLSKSVNQYQLGCERAQMDNWLCFN